VGVCVPGKNRGGEWIIPKRECRGRKGRRASGWVGGLPSLSPTRWRSVDGDKSCRCQRLDLAVLGALDDHPGLGAWLDALEAGKRARLLSALDGLLASLDGLVVGSAALEEVLAAAGRRDVLDADVDALADEAVADLLEHLDAHGAARDVPDLPGFAVLELVWHAIVDRAVRVDVDIVAQAVGVQIGRQPRHPMLAEPARKLGPCPCPVPVRMRHRLRAFV